MVILIVCFLNDRLICCLFSDELTTLFRTLVSCDILQNKRVKFC
jgi:hypothetical protein